MIHVEKKTDSLHDVVLQHVKIANQNKQALYIQVTAEWCGPCHKLRASMGHPLMKDAFLGTYILRIDYDVWKKQLSGLNINDKVVPIFYKIDSKGMATNYSINGGAWGEDIPENMAPPLKKYFLNK